MGEQRKKSLLHVYIPEEIILQILTKLPVKSLLRFQCVCKLWQSLITDPEFSLSSEGRERAIFCCSEGKPKESGKYVLEKGKILESLDHHLSLQQLPNPVGKALDHTFLFLGSCNGLLLFCASTAFSHSACVYLWNPSTGRFRELTQLYGLIKNSPSFKGLGMLSGLCFDQTSDDYKIVLINENSAVYVASLRRGIEWKAISFPYKIPKNVKVTRSGVLIKGHLHWLVKEQTTSDCAIVYFDETTNRFDNLPMPEPQRFPTLGYEILYRLGDLDGCLCLLVSRYQSSSLRVFVMREYGVKESWTKVNLLNLPDWLPPLYSTRLGGNLLFRERCYMIAYNLKEESLKKIKLRGNRFIDDGPIEYVETLASIY